MIERCTQLRKGSAMRAVPRTRCGLLVFFAVWSSFAALHTELTLAADRPNILWISLEDTSPDLGCYGDKYAVTPNLDRLGSQGCRHPKFFTQAGGWAPARRGA